MSLDCLQFFIYGTLLPGQCRWYLLERLNAKRIAAGTTKGWLLHLGGYPGLVDDDWFEQTRTSPPGTDVAGHVLGQVVQVPNLKQACLILDAEEDCLRADQGFDHQGRPLRCIAPLGDGLYVRRLRRIILSDGAETWAWSYHFNQGVDSPVWIASGNWLLA
ncbi:MAG: gamma-glutamylcyclotransferase [Planctomycetaceae bacterium]|nr:gamma-glutamylcyclotransferase [Planctomycetaceae bacterium]